MAKSPESLFEDVVAAAKKGEVVMTTEPDVQLRLDLDHDPNQVEYQTVTRIQNFFLEHNINTELVGGGHGCIGIIFNVNVDDIKELASVLVSIDFSHLCVLMNIRRTSLNLFGQFFSWGIPKCCIIHENKKPLFPMINTIQSDLERQKIRCWSSQRNLLAGDSFRRSYQQAIEKSDRTIGLFTESAHEDQTFLSLITFTHDLEKRPEFVNNFLIPAVTGDLDLKGMPPLLEHILSDRKAANFHDWQDEATREAQIRDLVSALRLPKRYDALMALAKKFNLTIETNVGT